MAKLLKLRRGTTTQHSSFTGAEGEVTIDTTKDTAVVHDGSTQGGRALLREDASNLPDQSIQLNHLPHGTSSNNGKFLRANNGADPTFETVNTDLVSDTTPQLGGALQSNGNDIEMANNDSISLGGGAFTLTGYSGNNIYFEGDSTGSTVRIRAKVNEEAIRLSPNQQVELYYDNNKKLETTSIGTSVTGNFVADCNNGVIDPDSYTNHFATGAIQDGSGWGVNGITFGAGTGHMAAMGSNNSNFYMAYGDGSADGLQTFQSVTPTGEVELYRANSKKFETNSNGVEVFGHIVLDDNRYLKLGNRSGTADVQIFHNGANFHIQHLTSGGLYMDSIGDHNFRNSAGTEYRAEFKNNGAVDLYYDNARKISTKSTGVEIPGNCAIELDSGNWTGNHPGKIQHHNNYLYLQGGTNGFIFMDDTGTGTAFIDSSGTLRPGINNTYDLGSSSYRWANIHTNDLHLSNEGHSNEMDGSWGNWTIQEGESDLFLKNNRSGKKYKFNLTEVA